MIRNSLQRYTHLILLNRESLLAGRRYELYNQRIEVVPTIACPLILSRFGGHSHKNHSSPRWNSLDHEKANVTNPDFFPKLFLWNYEEDTPFCSAQQQISSNTLQTCGSVSGADSQRSKTQCQTRSILWSQ